MSLHITKLQKRLCNVLQDGLPIRARPFADLGKLLETDEKTALEETRQLKERGVIKRIGTMINHRALGMTSTLVTGHVPEEALEEVAEAVNALKNVSHNYIRKHNLNLWFTLQGESQEQIDIEVSKLSGRFGIDFYSLPVERVFKLDVRFDAEGEGQPSGDTQQVPKSEIFELNDTEKQILSKLQDEIEVTERPFHFLCGAGIEIDEVLNTIKNLIDKGVIRRLGAVVDHRKLGFVANVLFCCEVQQERIIEAGKKLARFGIVSHCYERKRVKNWPYNLFAMMHGRSMVDIQHVIDKFTKAEGIESFELLPTEAELKKEPVRYVRLPREPSGRSQ
ncbi:MAG: hypothetical protein JSV82_08835 [Planctomycetota bacterium]|nr:MAG: hypothetical protein JSV82_08835 [Planctomycetota bacterium]